MYISLSSMFSVIACFDIGFWRHPQKRSGYPRYNDIAVLWFLGLAALRKGPNPVRTVERFAVEVGLGWDGPFCDWKL